MNVEKKIKWCTLDSYDGERTLKQHAFVSAFRKRSITRETYEGNHALCNHRAGVMNENEEFEPFDKIDAEVQKPDCCAVCARLSKAIE